MRYGAYRFLAPEKDWTQNDPEDFLAAGLERSATVGSYLVLARQYADAGRTAAALSEYRHVLELAPDSPVIHDAMAVLLWKEDKKEDAIAEWRSSLNSLNRIQNNGPAPQSFWSSFRMISQHLSARKLSTELHPEMDALLHRYIRINGEYRSDELLAAAFQCSDTPGSGLEWILSLSTVAANPAAILASIDNAMWLPVAMRETILQKEIELARVAAANADPNDFSSQQLTQLQKTLALYYVAQKQDAKALASMQQLTTAQREDADVRMAEFELAARSHRIDGLLASLSEDSSDNPTSMSMQLLRSAAATLSAEGYKAEALAIWEYVFEHLQTQHDLMTSDYLGLAEARLDSKDVNGAVSLLRRMTLLPSEGDSTMRGYDQAASLLIQKGHDNEAIEFLLALVKGVPWNSSYRLRLARTQVRTGTQAAEAFAALGAVAADNHQSYELRLQAALAMKGNTSGSPDPGSAELRLLASGKVAPGQAQQSYFVAARIVAADGITDLAQRASLLRQAAAISPNAVVGLPELAADQLALRIFRTEAALGHNAIAIEALHSLVSNSTQVNYADEGAEGEGEGGPQAESNPDASLVAGLEAEMMEGTVASTPAIRDELSALEEAAPIPALGIVTDDERIAFSTQVAQVYERTGTPANALPYLKLAAFLQKDIAQQTRIRSHIHQIQSVLKLESENSPRRPKIQESLNQSGIVRPRLSAVELAHMEAQ
jgi:tetratricopeptide (TPR) repeat protein